MSIIQTTGQMPACLPPETDAWGTHVCLLRDSRLLDLLLNQRVVCLLAWVHNLLLHTCEVCLVDLLINR